MSWQKLVWFRDFRKLIAGNCRRKTQSDVKTNKQGFKEIGGFTYWYLNLPFPWESQSIFAEAVVWSLIWFWRALPPNGAALRLIFLLSADLVPSYVLIMYYPNSYWSTTLSNYYYKRLILQLEINQVYQQSISMLQLYLYSKIGRNKWCAMYFVWELQRSDCLICHQLLYHTDSSPLHLSPVFWTILSSEPVFADFSNPNRRWFAMTDGLLGARFPIGGQRNQSSDLLN